MWAVVAAGALLLCASHSLPGQAQVRPGATGRAGAGTTTTGRAGAATTTGRGTTGLQNSAFTSGTRQYRNNTVLGDAVIQVDPESRSLVIISDEETHGEISKIIQDLDRPKPQVLIKVLFAEVTYNDGVDFGIEGSYTFRSGDPLITGTAGAIGQMVTSIVNTIPSTTGTGGTTTTTTTTTPVFPENAGTIAAQSLFGLANSASPIAPPGATGNLIAVLTSDYQATLRAIASRGRLNVLSRPSIMARNNQEAVIVVGQEVPFVTNSQVTDSGVINNTIQYNDVGTILRVTPFINANRTVEMIVAPEISQVTDSTVAITNNVTAPLINKRSAETVVVTPNATTVVIGGLISTIKNSTVNKVPILGDIPILGLPFRRTLKTTQKQELVIFLTPYIVDNPREFKDVTLDEVNRTKLLPKAFTREELNENLDTLEILPPPEDATYERVEVRRAKAVEVTEEKDEVIVRPSFR